MTFHGLDESVYKISGPDIFPFNDGFFTRFNWDLSSVYIFTCSNARHIHGDATCSANTDGRSRYFRATLRYLIPTRLELFALLSNHFYI